MPEIVVNADGTIRVVKTKDEIVKYYDREITKRIQAMLKLHALGGDATVIQNKIQQLNNEKKQKLMGGG